MTNKCPYSDIPAYGLPAGGIGKSTLFVINSQDILSV